MTFLSLQTKIHFIKKANEIFALKTKTEPRLKKKKADSKNMKSLSILLSLTLLSTGLSAIEDTGRSQTERNRKLQSGCTTPEVSQQL